MTYGGFLDLGYLHAFNDPLNEFFRSRGTAWHLNDLYLEHDRRVRQEEGLGAVTLGHGVLVQTGKDDEIFGFSATAPNIDGSEWLRHLGLANVSYLAPAGKGLTLQGGSSPA